MSRASDLLESLSEMDSIDEVTEKTKRRLKTAAVIAAASAGGMLVGRGAAKWGKGNAIQNAAKHFKTPNFPDSVRGFASYKGAQGKSISRKGAAMVAGGVGTYAGALVAARKMDKTTKRVNGKVYVLKNGRWHLA